MGKKTKSGKGRLDKFYHLAKDQGYRARSAFKLVQLAKKFDFLSQSKVCLDLCAAPGGWSQVAQKNMPSGSKIIAIDLAPIKPMHGVTCMVSDITSEKCRSMLRKELKGDPADCVLHDGAPNVGSSWAKDAYGQNELTLHAMKLACEHLRQGGTFVTKVFRSQDYNSLLWVFNQLFNKVDATKPTASRNVSAEIFVMCIGFKGGKIDPRFYDPKWVFMETVEPIEEGGKERKKPGASLTDYMKSLGRRHRGGYEDGDDNKRINAHDFLASDKPAELLVTHHKMLLDVPGSEEIAKNPLTTDEVRDCCADLKVLGKRDLSLLLKWRVKLLRELVKAEKGAKKTAAEVPAGKPSASSEDAAAGSAQKATSSGAADLAKQAIEQDVDDAIAQFLDGAEEPAGATDAAESDAAETDSDAEEEEIARELDQMVEKRRREERNDQKRIAARLKKAEWRKKMSLQQKTSAQDETELFKGTERGLIALENEDARVPDSDAEGSAVEDSDESDSDEELDRYARMEIDLAVAHQLRKRDFEEKNRKSVQRQHKKKKESRRQRVMAAWAGEMSEFNKSLDDQAYQQHLLKDKEDEEADGFEDEDSDDDLQTLRDLQKASALTDAADGEALEALADGPGLSPAALEAMQLAEQAGKEEEEENEQAGASTSTALVPAEKSEEMIRSQHRAARWFSQDIFKHVGVDHSGNVIPLDQDSSGDDDEDNMREVDDKDLPKMPLTDKEKRKLKRKKDQEKLERLGKKPRTDPEQDTRPLEVAPLEEPQPLVQTAGPQKPSDPRELAETLALGSLLVDSKKSRMDIIDAAYNRYAFDGDEALPDWFTEDENANNKPELPITKELMDQFRAKLREINARPIRKVAEAKARKKRRMKMKLDKLRKNAMSMADVEMSESAKARQMRKLVSKAAREDRRKVTTVAVKKGGGANQIGKGKIPKGAKMKVVDKRLKSDTRSEKRALKRAGAKGRAKARKHQIKKQAKRRGTSGGGKKDTGGRGIYGGSA